MRARLGLGWAVFRSSGIGVVFLVPRQTMERESDFALRSYAETQAIGCNLPAGSRRVSVPDDDETLPLPIPAISCHRYSKYIF